MRIRTHFGRWKVLVPYHAAMTFSTATVTVTVPATSANLGPGFDFLGVALALHDKVTARIGGRSIRVKVVGHGAGELPTDARHLIADVMLDTFDRLGERPPGIQLECRNDIPQARGLGSSSAAIVAGIMLARQLFEGGPSLLNQSEVIRLAAEREGHPDNVAPCVLGGFTIAWDESAGPPSVCTQAVRLHNANGVVPIIFVPERRGYTAEARAVLPTSVPLTDAVFNGARTALLLSALTGSPEWLFEGTKDRLHQDYRAAAMPETAAFVSALRQRRIAAVVSGAGPSVLALIPDNQELIDEAKGQCPEGWSERKLKVDLTGARVSSVD
jgi:homoserine kinase